ncbi:MAG: DNA cytosine methyltransferase [Bacteroidales bacterium]|nr:DNA cytosine methyltransferase [Bacteroidales bacterium]
MSDNKYQPREFHLFAGIGGGIYGGELLGHKCVAGVEIDKFCQSVLLQRQKDGWMDPFEIYGDLTKLSGVPFKNQFDILCGGFPCQAFSYAAHGNNLEHKNLWPEMLRFVQESEAPIVFGENVTIIAIEKAVKDLEKIGYKVAHCRLACMDIGADHKRPRFWLLAVKDQDVFKKVATHIRTLPKLTAKFWTVNPFDITYPVPVPVLAPQKRGVGNAQAPIAAAIAFRVLVNRLLGSTTHYVIPSREEIERVYDFSETWMHKLDPSDPIYIHTPTTMGNYHYKSMMKHPSCAKYVRIFGKPTALQAEYLMGFPIGASSPMAMSRSNFEIWKNQAFN